MKSKGVEPAGQALQKQKYSLQKRIISNNFQSSIIKKIISHSSNDMREI